MALLLGRGLDSDRQLRTPSVGELLYTTDKREVWVGDGSTRGGNRVTGAIPTTLNDLDNVDISINEAIDDQILKWDGENFVLGDAVVTGGQYTIDIIGSDGSLMIDSQFQQLNASSVTGNTVTAGEFIGNGAKLIGLDTALAGNNYNLNIVGKDSTILVDADTNTITGNFVGDGSGLTNVNVSDSIGIFDLNNVFKFSEPDPDDMLIWDGVNFTPGRIRQIIGDDSSVMLDTDTKTFTGDGSGLTNIDLSNRSVFDLNNVFAFSELDPGDMLIWDGVNFTPGRIRQIIGDDSSVMLDTDTKTFTGDFVGDGSGLTNIDLNDKSVFDLNDVFAFSEPDLGDMLIWDGFNFTPDRIRQIIGDDSTVMLDTDTKTFTGNFVGDGSGLTNIDLSNRSVFDLNNVFAFSEPDPGDMLIWNGFNFEVDRIRQIIGDDSAVMLDTNTLTFTGNFAGDGSGLTNIDLNDKSVFDLNDVFKFSEPDPDDMLIWDGVNFTPGRIRQIIGDDSSVMLDTDTQTFTGNFVGDGSGLTNIDLNDKSVFDLNDVVETKIPDPGDMLIWDGFNFTPDRIRQIIGDDSTVILDADTQTLTASIVTDELEQTSDRIRISSRNNVQTKLLLESLELPSKLDFYTVSANELNNYTSPSSILNFGHDDVNGMHTTVEIRVGGDGYFYVAADKDGLPSAAIESASMIWRDYRLGLGTYLPTATLDVRGEVVVESYVQFGYFTTTERDSFTAQNGMVIYNSTVNKFQGVENGTWINLSDGTAG